jgi:hypothetical protein
VAVEVVCLAPEVVPTIVAWILVGSTTELMRRSTTMVGADRMTLVADVVAQARRT